MLTLNSKCAGKSSTAKLSARLAARAAMSFLFQNRDDVLEAFDVGRGRALQNRLLQCRKVATHTFRRGPTFGS